MGHFSNNVRGVITKIIALGSVRAHIAVPAGVLITSTNPALALTHVCGGVDRTITRSPCGACI